MTGVGCESECAVTPLSVVYPIFTAPLAIVDKVFSLHMDQMGLAGLPLLGLAGAFWIGVGLWAFSGKGRR